MSDPLKHVVNLGKQEIDELPNYKPYDFELPVHDKKEMVEHYLDSNGKHRIKGGRDLKSSQSYPLLCLVRKKTPVTTVFWSDVSFSFCL